MRKGKVSDIDYDNGMVSVIYADGEGGITDMLPCLNIGDEYKMPEIGEIVAIGKMSSGRDIVLGKLWSHGNKPEMKGKGMYHKRLSTTAIIFASDSDNVKLQDTDIVFETDYGMITVTEIMKRLERLEGGE